MKYGPGLLFLVVMTIENDYNSFPYYDKHKEWIVIENVIENEKVVGCSILL